MAKHLSIFSLVLGLAAPCFAATGLFTNIHHQYQSIRAMGMGDAFIAIADDNSALFYNPAGYARREDGEIQLTLIDLDASTDDSTLYNTLSGLQGSGSTNIVTISNAMLALYGSQYQARIKALESSWARPHWGMALVPLDFSLDLAINNQVVPAIDIRAYADTTLAVAIGRNIGKDTPGILSWGLTVKGIQREYTTAEVNSLALAIDSSALSNALQANEAQGLTVDADLGFMYTPYLGENAWEWLRKSRPTVAVVARNLADAGFNTQVLKIPNANNNGAPEQLYRVYDIGSKFEIPKFSIFGGRFALDERDIGHPQFNWHRGLHTGFEFDWQMASWWKGQWRVGFGEGSITGGFSALFTVFRLDLATYGDDVGTYNSASGNRAVALRMAADF